MSPRDGGSTESLAGASNSLGETIDWSWIDNLNVEGGEELINNKNPFIKQSFTIVQYDLSKNRTLIAFLDASIVEDDLNRLVQIFNEGRYTPMISGSDSDNEDIPSKEEFEKLRKMFKLATHALKVYSDYLVH